MVSERGSEASLVPRTTGTHLPGVWETSWPALARPRVTQRCPASHRALPPALGKGSWFLYRWGRFGVFPGRLGSVPGAEEPVVRGPGRGGRIAQALVYPGLAGAAWPSHGGLPKSGNPALTPDAGPASLVPRERRRSRELLDLWERLVIYCVMETSVFGARETVQARGGKKNHVGFPLWEKNRVVTGIAGSQGLEAVLCHLERIYIPSKRSLVPVCVLGPVQVWTERSQLRARAALRARRGRELQLGLEMGSRPPKWICWAPGRSHPHLPPRASDPGRSCRESVSAVELGFGDGDTSRQPRVPEGEDFLEPSLPPVPPEPLERSAFGWKPRQLGEAGWAAVTLLSADGWTDTSFVFLG